MKWGTPKPKPMSGTILDGCRILKMPLPVSAADLHGVYSEFLAEGFEPNTMDSPCWRGTCDCLESYGTDPFHAQSRQRILDHLALLNRE